MLRINLSTNHISAENLPEQVLRKYIGGRALGAWLLAREVSPGINPLSAENKLLFMTGPLTGTMVNAANRYLVVTKSPQTGLFLDSYAGGFFGPELKFAGYDILIIEGVAKTPAYVWIHNDRVEIRDAGRLWGRLTWEAEEELKKEVGEREARVAVIGPAGENLSGLAMIQNDYHHQCGRGGAGAVMGSKKLKAVVVRGTRGIATADPRALVKFFLTDVKNRLEKQGSAKQILEDRMRYGTPLTMNITNPLGILPVENFTRGYSDDAAKIDGHAIREKVVVADKACYGCYIPCLKFSRVREGPLAGARVGGPEYETNALFGSNLGVYYPEALVDANMLCDQLGLDTIGAGNVLGFAIECFQRGIITTQDTGGLELKFGDYGTAALLVEKIAYRKDIGNVLADGVLRAAKVFGGNSEDFAMHGRGLEFPGYRPGINSPGMALAYAVTERGACHRRGLPAMAEHKLKPFSTEGRAKLFKAMYDERIPAHCGVCCDIATRRLGLDYGDFAAIYSWVTGWDVTASEMALLAERSAALAVLYNLREGCSMKAAGLPKRIFGEETGGPGRGLKITPLMVEEMMQEYFRLRGWDENGIPSGQTLEKLGIEDIGQNF